MKDILSNPFVGIFFFIGAYPWVLLALPLLVVVAYFAYKKLRGYKDIDLQIPVIRRTDVKYGYYSSLERTFEQVKDHVNLFWSGFYGTDTLIGQMKKSDASFVLDLAGTIGTRIDGKLHYNDTAEKNLRELFDLLRAEGVLNKVGYLYPLDEPNMFAKDENDFMKMVQVTKKIRSEYSELANSKIMVIYGRREPFWCLNEVDVAGVDDYSQKSESLTIGEHARLVKELGPEQKTILVPGPAFGHNPDPWVAYALLNPNQVEVVAPFLWFDDPGHKDVPYTGLEAADPAFKEKWVNAGNILTGKPGY